MNMFVVLTYLWAFLVGVAVGAWLNELTNGPARRVSMGVAFCPEACAP